MKQFFLGALITVVFFGVGGFVYLRLGLAGVPGDVPPFPLESSLLRMGVHASVRRQAPEIANPSRRRMRI